MAPPSWLTVKNQDVIIDIHAQPGAKRSEVVGEHGGRLKIAIASPPVDGKANSALIAFLAKTLGVSKSSVSILSGETSRQKRLIVHQINDQVCMEKILG
jgi:uncharacterized protein (TIGR00251 family)